jgi:hypothetical protein
MNAASRRLRFGGIPRWRAEAERTLAGVHHWFTEGLATADLREDKALPDDLARGQAYRV